MLLFVFSLFILFESHFINAQTGSVDTPTLTSFFSATGGSSSWVRNDSWLIGNPCDNAWFGVTCSPTNRVTGLNLTNNGLTGTLPASISTLSQLELLSLTNNSLGGTITTYVRDLTKLKYLSLAQNRFNGSIPTSLWTVSALTHVDLSSNLLMCDPLNLPIWKTSLVFLNLSTNQFTGPLPDPSQQDLVQATTTLQVFDLSNNQFSGTLSAPLFSFLRNTEEIYLNQNQFSGSIVPEVLTMLMTTAQKVSLADNQLSGTLPSLMSPLVAIQSLDLSRNQFSGTFPQWVYGFSVQQIRLSGNQFSGTLTFPDALVPTLQLLDVSSNQLSAFKFNANSDAQLAITTVVLSNNQFAISIPTLFTDRDVYLANNFWKCPLPSFMWSDRQITRCTSTLQMDFLANKSSVSPIMLACGRGPLQLAFSVTGVVAMKQLHVAIGGDPQVLNFIMPLLHYRFTTYNNVKTEGDCLIELSKNATSVPCTLPYLAANKTATLELSIPLVLPGALPKLNVTLAEVDSVTSATTTYNMVGFIVASPCLATTVSPPNVTYDGGAVLTMTGMCFLPGYTACLFTSSSGATYRTAAAVTNDQLLTCVAPAMAADANTTLTVSNDNLTISNGLPVVVIGPPTGLQVVQPDVVLARAAPPATLINFNVAVIDQHQQPLNGPLAPFPQITCALGLNGTLVMHQSFSIVGSDSFFKVAFVASGTLAAAEYAMECRVGFPFSWLLSIPIRIVAGLPAMLVLQQQPGHTIDNVHPIDPPPVLAFLDLAGNRVPHSDDFPASASVRVTFTALTSSSNSLKMSTLATTTTTTTTNTSSTWLVSVGLGSVTLYPTQSVVTGISLDGYVRFPPLHMVGLHGTTYALAFQVEQAGSLVISGVSTATPISVDACGGDPQSPFRGKTYAIPQTPGCRPCPTGAICDPNLLGLGVGGIAAQEGYWTPDPRSEIFVKCLPYNPDLLDIGRSITHCLGGPDPAKTCANGRTGRLCETCKDGFGMTFRRWCSPCRGFGWSLALIIIIFIVYCLVVAFLTVCSIRLDVPSTFVIIARMTINHLHLTSRIPELLTGVYPLILEGLFSIARFCSEFTFEVSYTRCGLHWGMEETYIAYMVLPWIVAFLPAVLIICYKLLPDRQPQENYPYDRRTALDPPPELRATLSYRTRFQRSFGWFDVLAACASVVGLLVFPIVVQQSGWWIRCTDSPGEMPWLWLAADPTINCNSPVFDRYHHAGLGLFIIYLISLILFPFAVILPFRAAFGEKAAYSLFGFALGGYRPEVWWWESVITVRKLLYICVVIFGSSPRVRAYLALLILCMAFATQITIWPYAQAKYNKMELASLGTTIISLLGGLFLSEGTYVIVWCRLGITVIILILQLATFSYFLHFLFRHVTRASYRMYCEFAYPAPPIDPASPEQHANINADIAVSVETPYEYARRATPKSFIPFPFLPWLPWVQNPQSRKNSALAYLWGPAPVVPVPSVPPNNSGVGGLVGSSEPLATVSTLNKASRLSPKPRHGGGGEAGGGVAVNTGPSAGAPPAPTRKSGRHSRGHTPAPESRI